MQVLTREFKYVKPDRRLLLHVADALGVAPGEMLMVGDSKEDVEVGAMVGASTCLIAGGGNEPFATGRAAAAAAARARAERVMQGGRAPAPALVLRLRSQERMRTHAARAGRRMASGRRSRWRA